MGKSGLDIALAHAEALEDEVERLRRLIAAFLHAYNEVIDYTHLYVSSGGTSDRMPKRWEALDRRRLEAIAAMQAALAGTADEVLNGQR